MISYLQSRRKLPLEIQSDVQGERKKKKEGLHGRRNQEIDPRTQSRRNGSPRTKMRRMDCRGRRLTFNRTFSRQVVFEKVLTLPALEKTPFRIRSTVVPSDRTLLNFDMTSGRPLREKKNYTSDAYYGQYGAYFSVVLENLFDLSQPAHIQDVGEICPLCLTGSTHETTVLSGHTETFNVSQVLCQKISVTAGDEIHQILGICAQAFERLESGLRGDGHAWSLDDRRQGTLAAERVKHENVEKHDFSERTHIVIEEEQPLVRLEVAAFQFTLLHKWSLPGHDVFETHLLQKHLDQVRTPRMTGVEVDDLVHLVVPLSFLLWAHGEATVDCSGDITETPWVDLESLRHVVRNAHEFGEDERTLLGLFLGNNELHRCGIHTITERGDEGEVGDGQEGVEFVLFYRLVVMVDGNEVQRTVLSVDVSDELGYLTLQFWRVCQGRRSDLDKDDLSNPLWIIL